MIGYTDTILRFDLTKKSHRREELAHETLKTWLGGTGLGVKYMMDEVPADVTWDDPRNLFIMSNGPLSGTIIRGSGAIGVVTKGALTGGLATSQANGYMGAFLRFCGYAGVIISGQSPDWVSLYIDDDNVEIKSAEHLIGLDTVETQDALLKEYGLKRTQMSVYCIGPAGENLVRFAMLIGDYGHVAAHNGIGAVLGKKKVKAIAIKKGSKKPRYHDRATLAKLAAQIHKTGMSTPAGKDCSMYGTNSGHPVLYKAGQLPIRNITIHVYPQYEDYSGKNLREKFEYHKRPCWACNWAHCGDLKITDGKFAGFETEEPEYEAMAAMGPLIGITDTTHSVILANWIDRMGLDCNETGWMTGWVMECYEKGYMSKDQLDGLEMKWGSFKETKQLIYNIAHRQGFGNLLAEGVKRASTALGSPAKDCAVYTSKGNTPRGHDHRANWAEHLDTCVSSTGTIETMGGTINILQHGAQPVTDRFSWEQIAVHNAVLTGRRVLEDSLGICRLCACEDIHETAQALTAATGDFFDFDTVMRVGRRVVNTMRVYNTLCGITGKNDNPSARYSSVVEDGPAEGVNIGEVFQRMKERYFELVGWDKKTGIPLSETLQELDLADLIPLIERMKDIKKDEE